MTKKDIDTIIASIKDYVLDLLNGWGLDDTEKSLVKFEKTYLPYTRYSGNQSIDHVVFRRFLRHFDPEQIELMAIEYLRSHINDNVDAILDAYQKKGDEGLATAAKTIVGAINEIKLDADGAHNVTANNQLAITQLQSENEQLKAANEALLKKITEVEQLAYAGL